MTDILLIFLLILFAAQIVTFYKVFLIVKQMNKLLFEVRLLFKHSGLFYEPQKDKITKSNSCQHCMYRISYIELTEEQNRDNFYYKCKKHNIEVFLTDSCSHFQRDYRQV